MSYQKSILVTSPQGGSGKSTIAVNMAIHYAKQNIKVLLIDLAVYGGIPAMLKIPIRGKGMSSLITALEQNEGQFQIEQLSEYFKDSIVTFEKEPNLHILLSASPLKMEKMTAGHTSSIIQIAKKEKYNMIIIDTSSEPCERNISAIEGVDLILIPTLQDVTSGWKVILFKELLDNLSIPREKVALIINRCNKHSGFNNQEFQTEIGYPIIYEIDDISKDMQKYANMGIPAENSGKKSASAPFQKLAAKVLKKVRD